MCFHFSFFSPGSNTRFCGRGTRLNCYTVLTQIAQLTSSKFVGNPKKINN